VNLPAVAVLIGGFAIMGLCAERLFALQADSEARRRRLAKLAEGEALRQEKHSGKLAEPYRRPSKSLWQEIRP
jgi:hypothetical protein